MLTTTITGADAVPVEEADVDVTVPVEDPDTVDTPWKRGYYLIPSRRTF